MRRFLSLRGFEYHLFLMLGSSKARILSVVAAAFLIMASAAFCGEPDNAWVEKTLRHLSLREKIAQLIQVRVPGKFLNRQSPEFQEIKTQIRQNHVGGVVLFAGNVYESAILLNELQGLSKLPLLVAADFERGVSFRIADTTSFPWTMAIGATGSEQYSYDQGFITGQEARALGVHWIFAPVVDVNNNPDNPVINIRSYGEDAEMVARLGAAFIRGAAKAGVLTTAKHFPGHGDTAADSHIGLAVVESDMDRLQKVELVPFRSAIEAGVDSIMTAHVAVPHITGIPDIPATLSPEILTGLLRNALKFQGLVVTDALEMGAIKNSYWCGLAAIRALQAGADILLLPTDDTVAINEVERAVRRGDITEKRIDQSVRRVLNAKSRLGLERKRLVPVSRISEVVALPKSALLAQQISDRSVTAVRDLQHLLPVNPLSEMRIFSLVLASDLESSPGAAFQAELRRHFPKVRTAWGNARTSDELQAALDEAVSESDLVVCSTLSRLSSGQDTIAIPRNQQAILKKLVASQKPLIWVAFGNPYVLRIAPEASTYMCTFSYSDVSQISAAKAIAGEIEVTGKMPVSIPGLSKTGDGLRIPKLPMVLKQAAPETTRFESTRKLLDSYIEAGVFAGAELLVGHMGSLALDFQTGRTGTSPDSAGVSSETAFGLASLSKPVATASAAMFALDSSLVFPGSKVLDYLPELGSGDGGNIPVQELLSAFSKTNQVEASGSPAALIEKMVGRASGMAVDRYLKSRLFEPMGMKCGFRIPAKSESGELFCRGRDLALFAQMLLNKGMYDHRRYFKSETVVKYTGPKGVWSKPSGSEWASGLLSASSFGHNSGSGPALWIDPAKQLFFILLTAYADSSKPDRIAEAQRAVAESIISVISNKP